MCRMCRAKMCRALPGQNVLQRAPGVVPECVVLCVANHDTCDTFKLRVYAETEFDNVIQQLIDSV